MFFKQIEQLYGVPGMALFMLLSGLFLYFGLSGMSYLYTFVLRRDRFVPDYRPDRAELRRAIFWSMMSVLGNVVLMLPLQLLTLRSANKIYYDVNDHGWPYLFLTILTELAFSELLVYWIHRWLHLPFFFRHIHHIHHKFRAPTPLASLAFHPLDGFAQAVPHHLLVFLLPVNVYVYQGFILAVSIWTVLIHDRVSWIGWSAINFTGHHTAHHWFNRWNFGQFFTAADRLFGTYRAPDVLPERFFASYSPDHPARLARRSPPASPPSPPGPPGDNLHQAA